MILNARTCEQRSPNFYVGETLAEISAVLNPRLGDLGLIAIEGSFQVFRLVDDDSLTPNGSTILESNSCAYVWVLAGGGEGAGSSEGLSITLFGAVGDGTTDDTASIQATIDAAELIGASVFVPPTLAFYRTTTDLILPTNMRVFGTGPLSKIKITAIGNFNTFSAYNESGIVLEKLGIVANGHKANTNPWYFCGVFFDGCTNCRVEKCEVTNYRFGGVMLYESSFCEIIDNYFPSPLPEPDPLLLQSQSSDVLLYESGSNNRIERNRCGVPGGPRGDHGILCTTVPGSPAGKVMNGNIIHDNRVMNKALQGITLYLGELTHEVNDNQITENLIDDVDGSYLFVVPGQNGPTLHQAGIGIYCQSARGCVIRDNVIRNIGLYTRGANPIQVGGIGASGASDNLIESNKLENCYVFGIGVSNALYPANGTDIKNFTSIIGNKVQNCGRYEVTGTIQIGTDQLTLAQAGGWWVGDAISVEGAGVAGARLDTSILAINGAVLTIATNASTTATDELVYLSEVGNVWMDTNSGIYGTQIHRLSIHGNDVSNCYNNQIWAGGGGLFGNIKTPSICGNTLGGGDSVTDSAHIRRFGIRMQDADFPTIRENTINTTIIAGIQAITNIVKAEVSKNWIFLATTGVDISSPSGSVEQNFFEACSVGIKSIGTEILKNNRMVDCAVNYSNNSPIRAFANGDTTPSVTGADYWIVQNAVTITALDDGNVGDVVVIRALGATIILQNSAALAMRGGIDLTLLTTESATMQKITATDWVEIDRNKA